MTIDTIPRYDAPTLAQLQPLKSSTVDDSILENVRAILAGELDPSEASPGCAAWVASCHNRPDADSYQCKLEACADLLGMCGVVALEIENADTYTDEGIRMCPPFSYCNAGDTYAITLARDHENGAWVIACWGDLLEEYEKEHELGDYQVFDECPERCLNCHRDSFELEFFPGSARGPSYSWVCDSCNSHCFAQSAEDAVPIGEDDSGETAYVHARKPNGMPWCFYVKVGQNFLDDIAYPTAQAARDAWEERDDADFKEAGRLTDSAVADAHEDDSDV